MGPVLWIATAAFGLHFVEKYALDWRGWARSFLRLNVEPELFYLMNGVVILVGVTAAEVANRFPGLALTFGALLLVNAIAAHIVPMAMRPSQFVPGIVSATTLLLPIGVWVYVEAYRERVLSWGGVLGSFVIAAVLMASPVVLLKVRDLRYFDQG